MKLKTLNKMFDAAGLCVDNKSSKSILSGVLFEVTDGGECRLTTTDLCTTIRVEADARGTPAMRLVLPWRQTRDVVRAFADKDVDVALEADPSVESKPALRLSVGSSNRRVAGSRSDDFLDTPTAVDELGYAEQLPRMLKHIKCALAHDVTRLHLCLRMERDANGFRVIATDGYRLAKAEVPGRAGNALGAWNVPSDGAIRVVRLFAMCSKSVIPCIVASEGHIGVRVEIDSSISATMLVKEATTEFPMWRRVVPMIDDEHTAKIRVRAQTLRERLASMKPITNPRVSIRISDERLQLDAVDDDGNTAHEEVAAETVRHLLSTMTVDLNEQLLCEALVYAPGHCDVMTDNALDPVRVRFADFDIEVEHIIMPMRRKLGVSAREEKR